MPKLVMLLRNWIKFLTICSSNNNKNRRKKSMKIYDLSKLIEKT